MKTKRGSGVWYRISSYCNTGELTDVTELPDLCPPVLRTSHSRVELVKSELPRTQVRTLRTWYWETAPDFPQLSQMVQSLPGFLNLCLDVCSPSQVLGDVYTEVLEAARPLHRGPTDHKRSVGQQVSLSEVYSQLFSFAHIQRETVVLAPWCESLYLRVYSMTKMVSVTQYVHLIMLKRFNIYELDNKRIHFVVRAVRFPERARPHTLLIDCDIWLILSRHVWCRHPNCLSLESCRVACS